MGTTRSTKLGDAKRVGRIIGVIGGVAAIVWAMRDRFVSIAAPREPEPPTFRVISTPPPPLSTKPREPAAEPDDLTVIIGVGPVFQRRLMEAGMATFASLADAEAERVAHVAGVTKSRAAAWITQAQMRRG